MVAPKTSLLVMLLSVTLIGGCGKARKDYEQQLEICTAGENNGVLSAAAEGCGSALEIARQNDFPPEEISDLSYRLGQIERKQGHFEVAESLVRASLDFETQKADAGAIASRLVELSIILAGQGRWEEGADLLSRAAHYVRKLDDGERKAAANALRGYAAQLDRLGDSEVATRFTALAHELALPVSGNTDAE